MNRTKRSTTGKMMRTWAAILMVGMLVGAASAESNDAGTTAGTLLRLGAGARVPAMGDAGTANSFGVSALHYNPAGLGFTNRAEVEAMYQNMVLDISQGQIGFEHPVNSVSSWGVHANYLDYGKARRVTLMDIINSNVTSSTFSGQDIVFGASYGRRLADNIALGVTGKILNQQIDNASATAVAADVGILVKPASWPVRFGVVGQNFGTKLSFDVSREQLPALVRGGVAMDLFNDRLTISAEVEKVRNQDVTAQVGGELRIMELLALRAGYDGRIDVDNGMTAGFGVKIADFNVDYAYVPFGNLGNTHRLALTYRFGPKY